MTFALETAHGWEAYVKDANIRTIGPEGGIARTSRIGSRAIAAALLFAGYRRPDVVAGDRPKPE